jgi:hypothetical protein
MLSAMQTRRWVDPSQPQTLQVAVFLFYIQAALNLLVGSFLSPIGLLIIAAAFGAGYGIANERKWGYGLGLLLAFLPFVLRMALGGVGAVFSAPLIDLMFEVALVVLLLHPQSRDYERIWFK